MVSEFIHFRTQSSYSMLESSIKIDDLVDLAAKNDMPAVALTDRGNLFASLEFSVASCKKKIQPIHGAILNIEFYNKSKEYNEILLIAKDEVGYKNLLKLVSYTFIKNDNKPVHHITFDDLISCQEGIIVLSAYTKGIIGKHLLDKEFSAAEAAARTLKDTFGDRFYFEVMRHDYKEEKQIESDYLNIAQKLNIPLIATNQVLFSNVQMHDSHDVLLCISEGVVRDQEDRNRVSNQCYFKSAAEMASLFNDLPEAIANTIHLSKRCYAKAETYPPTLPNFSDGASENELIRKESANGLEKKLSIKFEQEQTPTDQQETVRAEYFSRLNYELEIICSMNFSGYFLIVSDFIRWSKENGIAVGPGRGSGAGSIIAWALQITDLDPIKFGLLFERFLNPERVSMPDFDIDFCQERREEVINYVRRRYSDERVGQIITFGKMQAKAVIKDVARVLGLPYSFADYLTELVPFNAVNPVTLGQAIEEIAELNHAYNGKGLYNMQGEEDLIKGVLETALVLEGLQRHASTHAAGIVIANQPIIETVPLYKDSSGSDMNIVQYSMKYSELAGLVKFDFLGLQTLTVITKCLDLLRKQDIHIDIDKISYKDEKTYQMLARGLSTGVFQFESAGMKSALRKLKPDCVEDIIALGALYRPGPMENIPTYIACKHGLQEVDYLHPLLKEVLTETYGVIIYQEQVMEIARRLAGYSLGGADLLRRAMGKKVKAEMDAQEEIFVTGAVKNNVPAEQAKSIFATVAKFAGYGFNKSHASAYGVISYQTAYLKANYPAEFLVASLNLDMHNSDKVNIFLQEAKVFGIDIIPPLVDHSGGYFDINFKTTDTIVKKSIIFPIGAIKNVTPSFGNHVAEERQKNGPFKSVTNFLERIPPKLLNKRLLENIIKAGCFDNIYPNRNALLISVPRLLAYCNTYHSEQNSSQISLIKFSQSDKELIESAPDFTLDQLAFNEFEVMGLFLKNHPLNQIADVLSDLNVSNSKYLVDELKDGSYQLKLCGVIIKKDSRMSQRGSFVTLLISDPIGIYEITIFSEEVLREYNHLINIKSAVIINADVYKDEGGLRITARSFSTIENVLNGVEFDLKLYPEHNEHIKEIITILNSNTTSSQGNSNVAIFLPNQAGFMTKINFDHKIALDHNQRNLLKKFE